MALFPVLIEVKLNARAGLFTYGSIMSNENDDWFGTYSSNAVVDYVSYGYYSIFISTKREIIHW